MSSHPQPTERTGLSRSDNPAIAADPPAASDVPLRGQIETNRDAREAAPAGDAGPEGDMGQEAARQAAYDFGRRAALVRGQDRSSPLDFELHEAQLQQQWSEQHQAGGAPYSWEQARQAARDAWNKVQEAIVGG